MLTTDSIVKISLNLNAAIGSRVNFGAGVIIGTSDTLGEVRMKYYESLAEVIEEGFGTTTGEYIAATAYFAQTPQADGLWIARKAADESYAQCLTAVYAHTNAFWGIYMVDAVKSDVVACEAVVNANQRGMIFAQVPVDNATLSEGLLSTVKSAGSRRVSVMVSDKTHAAAAVMGKCAGLYVSHTANSFALCYKSLDSVQTDSLTASQVTAIEELNGNVYVTRGYDYNLFEHAYTGSTLRVDEVLYLDAMVEELKTEALNIIANSNDRLPQNDSTSGIFRLAMKRVLDKYNGMNVIGAGEWRGSKFGTLENGAWLANGYFVYIADYSTQSIADRAARKAMPINICCILAGSVESVQISVNVQQ